MLPNLLSALRICLVPLFILAYFAGGGVSVKKCAIAVYAFASFTDFLDGFLARRYKLTTELGKILDPLGDKLMTIAVLTCITIDGLIPVWAVLIAAVKESLMAVGGLILHRRSGGGAIPPSNIFGKASTVVFFLVCVTLMLFRERITGTGATAMISAALCPMLLALGSYAVTFSAAVKKSIRLSRPGP
ncbi:MAG: CDP-alcohol phosphatidyltransferase family protein [Oscillospiraceae bacterium]|jgi:CDP-diacylglycerol--glycerol-3-phosphate 3-phosphatidyltransferase|nr:CDP-alcohol phosphatidyltransferase family protein [Oscillospiraceae bacterium]